MPAAKAQETTPYDFVIKNALIFDGVSEQGTYADVGIRAGKIAAIGDIAVEQAEEMIDVEGLVLAPGFIDAHTHSDFNPMVYEGMHNKIQQGVTTEIVGNCGMAAVPVMDGNAELIHGVWAREGVILPAAIPWEELSDYRETLKTAGMSNHFAILAGHGNIRQAVMGNQARKPTAAEQTQIEILAEGAMKQGAVGISFGLGYVPGTFADRDEIAGICRVVARYQGVCSFHIRSESSELLEAIREVLQIGEASGVRLQISHLKAGGEKNWYKIDEVFKLIDAARERGVIVYADAYPYTASYAELGVTLPSRYYEREDRVEFFQDPANHPEIAQALHEAYGENSSKWRNTLIANIADESFKDLEGKTLEEIAALWQVEPQEALVELLAKTSFEVSAFSFSQSEDVIRRVFQQEYVMVGSDSIADGTLYPHPRAFGSFPKYLSEYTQGENGLPLGEAIRHITSLPAEQFGLTGRGRVAVGYYADLVIFDPETLRDRATYQNPSVSPAGIHWVFLDGQPVVQNGELTGLKEGEVLLRENESQTADPV